MENKIFISNYVSDTNKEAKNIELAIFTAKIAKYINGRKYAIKAKEKIWSSSCAIYRLKIEVCVYE